MLRSLFGFAKAEADLPVEAVDYEAPLPGCVVATNQEQLASQGEIYHADGSNEAVMHHLSTSPPKYYEFQYGPEFRRGINMDRGGYGIAKDGTMFGCVFDGVTAGGKVNAYAAQAFTNYTLKWLARNAARLSIDEEVLVQQMHQLFEQCTHFHNSRLSNGQSAEGGSATGAVAAFRQSSAATKDIQLLGGYIGDAAVVVVHPLKGARLLTRKFRRENNPSDTGGQIMMSMGLSGQVRPLIYNLCTDALVILTTDGFTDNIVRGELHEIVPLLIESTFFDRPVSKEVGVKDLKRLPDYDELFHLMQGAPREELAQITCLQAATRLANYIEWVTRPLYTREEAFFSLSLEHKILHQSAQPPDPAAVHKIETAMARLREERQIHKPAGKTDDCIILCMRPVSSRVTGATHA